MSANPYNSVLRSGLTRRLWLLITLAMLVPVSLALLSRWFEAEERRASLQNQELTALSRDKASTLLFSSRDVPEDFAHGLDGRYLVVLDGAGDRAVSQQPGSRRTGAAVRAPRAGKPDMRRAARRSSRGMPRVASGAAP